MGTSDKPFTRDDKKLFDKICFAISPRGKLKTIDHFHVSSAKDLDDKWEGYHLHYYVWDIYNRIKNKKLAGVNESGITDALRANSCHHKFSFLRQRSLYSDKGIGKRVSESIFYGLWAGIRKKPLEGLLDFLLFCENDIQNRNFAAFGYKRSGLILAIKDIQARVAENIDTSTTDNQSYTAPITKENLFVLSRLNKDNPDNKTVYAADKHKEPNRGQTKHKQFQPQKKSIYQLTDSKHRLLQPRENVIYGRVREIEAVVDFLNSTSSSAYVTECAGIGKTELCKAALKSWLCGDNARSAYWVQIHDDDEANSLSDRIKESVSLTDMDNSSFNELRSRLPNALYYLDNIESIADSPNGRQILRELCETPGIRILASSRIDLDGVFEKRLPISTLSDDESFQLFMSCWRGIKITNKKELRLFVRNQLGGHPLSIVLIARIGKGHSFESIKRSWEAEGTRLARLGKSTNRIDSLDISLSLTANMIADIPGALELWQFIALFPEHCNDYALDTWEIISGHHQARLALQEHHIYFIRDSEFSEDQYDVAMLPPLARYALQKDNISTSKSGFNWKLARKHAYRFFYDTIKSSEKNDSSHLHKKAQSALVRQYSTIPKLMNIDILSMPTNIEHAHHYLLDIEQLHQQLIPHYWFNKLHSYNILKITYLLLNDSFSYKHIADYAYRALDFTNAIRYYQETHNSADPLSAAWAHVGIGKSYVGLSKADKALIEYNKALEIYYAHQDESPEVFKSYIWGQAFTHLLLALMYENTQDYPKARDNIKLAHNLYQQLANEHNKYSHKGYKKEYSYNGLPDVLDSSMRISRGMLESGMWVVHSMHSDHEILYISTNQKKANNNPTDVR